MLMIAVLHIECGYVTTGVPATSDAGGSPTVGPAGSVGGSSTVGPIIVSDPKLLSNTGICYS